MTRLDQSLTNVAVVGAGGKMGSGIALLLLQEMSRLELSTSQSVGLGSFRLHLIDLSEKGLDGLYHYLRSQLRRHAEQIIIQLRDYWKTDKKLISNEQVIDAYVEGSLAMVRLGTEYSAAKDANLIFEAVAEDVSIKVALYKHLESINHNSPLYFTNTSSIPIQFLSEESGLNGRLIGFHFYNPPAVQKLLELIIPKEVEKTTVHLCEQLADRLQKIAVNSNDIAGFIGNGQFIREILYTLEKVRTLSTETSLSKAIAFYDRITRDLLIRPMGMFQLIDYVGLDVVHHIVKIMANFIPDPSMKVLLIDQLIAKGIKGGQYPDGSQRDGFFQYEKGKLIGVYALENGEYQPLPDLTQWLEPTLPSWKPWKQMQKERDLKHSLQNYFQDLANTKTRAAEAALEFLKHSRKISENLVRDRVAHNIEDVTTVLANGFFHLYGPDFDMEKLS